MIPVLLALLAAGLAASLAAAWRSATASVSHATVPCGASSAGRNGSSPARCWPWAAGAASTARSPACGAALRGWPARCARPRGRLRASRRLHDAGPAGRGRDGRPCDRRGPRHARRAGRGGARRWRQALDGWRRAARSRAVALTAAALGLGARFGGRQATAIDAIADAVRTRLAVRREVWALSAQARASALVMSVTPLAFAGGGGGARPAGRRPAPRSPARLGLPGRRAGHERGRRRLDGADRGVVTGRGHA